MAWGGLALIAAASGCDESGAAPTGDGGLNGAPTTGASGAPTSGGTATTGGNTTGGTATTSGGTTAGNTTGGTSGADGGITTGGTSGDGGAGNQGLPPGEAYGDWTYVEVEGALCRDGSPAGYYYREGSSPNLHIFLNGGGACADYFFCSLNPSNVNEDLPHERLINATGNLLASSPDPARQQPPNEGIFKKDPKNPVADWSAIFIPYCTGDVHAGTRTDVMVPGAEAEGLNQFVGYKNVGLFLESFGHHFGDSEKVLLSGSSAGAFGTLLNFDRVQMFFDQYGIDVYAVADSGIPMRDSVDGVDYMAPCLQKKWRELWGFDEWLPKDCTGCFRADGGGLVEGLGNYLFKDKYGDRVLGGFVSSAEDNVMRGFFGAGGNPTDPNSHCDNTDPMLNVIGEAVLTSNYPPALYHEGLVDAVDNVPGRDNISYFVMEGDKHMHLWRSRFYANEVPLLGESTLDMTIAEWLGEVLQGKVTHVGDIDP